MKKILIPMTILFATALFLAACGDNTKKNEINNSTGENQTTEEQDNAGESDSSSIREDKSKSDEAETNNSNETSLKEKENKNSSNQTKSEEDSVLSGYTSKEIEYARVWLQVIGNKDVQELNVQHIPAGEPVNPYDNDSADYPEDVIFLGGKIMADGVVTYSGNGDGTINLYDVPSHWQEGIVPKGKSMKEYTNDIINNTKLVHVAKGEDKDVAKLIEKLKIDN